MNINFDKEKSAKMISNMVKKTVDTGKKVASNTKKNITKTIDNAKKNSESRKLKKLDPVFPDEYKSKDFHLPNIIMIVDDAERKNIDLCEGAIGYLSKFTKEEMLCLYDEAIKFSGLKFVPAPICGSIYYVDNFDRKKFIQTDCIFSITHEERIAELEHIAYCLGAKKFSVEVYETTNQSRTKNYNTNISYKNQNSNIDYSRSQNQSFGIKGKVETEFSGSSTYTIPKLKWFEHHQNIQTLIKSIADKTNITKAKTLELSVSSSATMSKSTAMQIDTIMKKHNIKGNLSIKSQAEREHQSTLIYHIEF